MARDADPAVHWDDAYALGDAARSWFQQEPAMSLQMLDTSGASAPDSVIDVGGGASPLAGALLGRGFSDITVLDISAAAMRHARRRLGPRPRNVQWLVADVLTWRPPRCYEIWHDRAVFHFLTATEARQQYLRALDAATAPHALAVLGCFAPDGPQQCSGLPVARYSAEELDAETRPPLGTDRLRPRTAHHSGRDGPGFHVGSIQAAALTGPEPGPAGQTRRLFPCTGHGVPDAAGLASPGRHRSWPAAHSASRPRGRGRGTG